ncbi:sterol desaturase family protein [Trinickia terrae]|uniref:Sterol desaturase family protein n=1 Tax=Trinickia terrae TaxID=2571161 RepID=A0A4U1IFS0_9BURK|nr:sterol desaturase family protein [Trinickia terrae]TKC92593.1 sterol desaturase family protein [Trinickia terrae]
MSSSNSLLMLWHFTRDWLVTYSMVVALFSTGAAIERANPVQRLQSKVSSRLNVVYSVFYTALLQAAHPLTAACSVWLVGALGGGLVTLQSHGWCAIASFVVMVLTFDLLEYLFHRLEHSVPFLWRMHELHHSARAYNVTITQRHYWTEGLIKSALLYPIAGMLFKVESHIVVLAFVVFTINNYYVHLNARFSIGRFATWINSPQYHRIHHSRRPEHLNKNFAQMLPLWDRLFGTIWVPGPHEWPATGLADEAEPQSFAQALMWPWRERRAKSVPVGGKTV